jgi:hypothetical protein
LIIVFVVDAVGVVVVVVVSHGSIVVVEDLTRPVSLCQSLLTVTPEFHAKIKIIIYLTLQLERKNKIMSTNPIVSCLVIFKIIYIYMITIQCYQNEASSCRYCS